MQLADHLRETLAPHGGDQPVIWSDLLAEQLEHVLEHWLTHDTDGQHFAWRTAHPDRYRETV